MSSNKEIWKYIKGCDFDYFVSNKGQIKSFCKRRNDDKKSYKILKPHDDGRGYLSVVLKFNGVFRRKMIHRLVGKAFIPNPENKPEINHKNLDKSDNRVENLEWCTRKENLDHAYDNGVFNTVGSSNGNASLTEDEVIEIRKLCKECNYLQREIAEMFNVSTSAIKSIKHKRTWAHI